MAVHLEIEELHQARAQHALALSCADCGGDFSRGYALADESGDELVCLCCDWFRRTERDGML